MALYKSSQDLNEIKDEHFGDEDEVVLYDEKPSEDDVIEMHQPEEAVEISFKLPPLPGSDAEVPLEVSTDDPVEVSSANDLKDTKKEIEVSDPWSWQQHGPANILQWVKDRFSNIPRHSGRETAGIERAISYLKRLNGEMSKAASSDFDGKIDIQKFEEARKEIYSAIDRLEEAKGKLEDTHYKKKKSNLSFNEIVKEAKQDRIGGIIITVPILISRIAKVLINGMVSGGHDIADMYHKQVKEYSLDKRDQAELLELLENMGYAMPRMDRGHTPDTQIDYKSSDNFDFGANYPS